MYFSKTMVKLEAIVVYTMDFGWALYTWTLYMDFVYELCLYFGRGLISFEWRLAYKQHYNGSEDKYYSSCKF